MLLLAFLFASWGGGFVSPAFAVEPSNFQLRASAQADSTGVYLNEVLDAAATLPALRLGDSPAFGKSLSFTRAQIAALAHAAGSDLDFTNLAGANAVFVTRRSRVLTEAGLLALLTETLQRDYVKDKGELELRPTRPWTEVSLPDEPLTLKILEIPTAGVTSSFITRFEIRTAREGLGVWQTSQQAHIWRDVWVAHSPIRRGEALADADLSRDRRDMLAVRDPLADFDSPTASLEFAEPVTEGAPLLARMLKPRNVVRRGQIAQAIYHDGALSITMKVELLDDGAPGQMVHARNPVSRRAFSGKVLDEQTLLINL